MLIQLGYIWG